ncbi:MAG: hypothetical protein KIT84_37325 [Labilithrix sp.]|nr:hypothetical protein [Labilithrix sp.]MCW5816721.1 hypothetical protein [Labilithrix sp.]
MSISRDVKRAGAGGRTSVRAVAVALMLAGCAGGSSSPKPVDGSTPDAATPPPAASSSSSPAASSLPELPAPVDAGPPPPEPAAAPPTPPAPPKVKVENIGMHVGGGPFDEPTKEPFKKAVYPHHPAMAECWAKHVKRTKPFDVGVDLLIEGAGGHPKVSNPRVRLEKGEDDGFVPCLIGVFEAIEFPKLERGKSGVSYSLRFTPTP